MSACGSSDAPATNTSSAQSCQAGYVGTTSGCVPQGQSCSVNNTTGTLYNGQCLQITSTGTNTSCPAGQTSLVSYGCQNTTSSCTVSGSNVPGMIYNNTCVQVNTSTYGSGTSCPGGQTSLLNYGCQNTTSTCTVSGSNLPGMIYNNTCVQVNTYSGGYNNGSYGNFGGGSYYGGQPVGYNGGTNCINAPVIINGMNTGIQCLIQNVCPNGELFSQTLQQCMIPTPLSNGGLYNMGYGGGYHFSYHYHY